MKDDDPNKLARDMAEAQRQAEAQGKRNEAAAAQARLLELQHEIEGLAGTVYAALKERGFASQEPPVMKPISMVVKYNSVLGRTKRKDVAGWEITRFTWSWKDGNPEATVWLLADAELAVQNGGPSYEIRKATVYDLFLAAQNGLPAVRDGLRKMAAQLGR